MKIFKKYPIRAIILIIFVGVITTYLAYGFIITLHPYEIEIIESLIAKQDVKNLNIEDIVTKLEQSFSSVLFAVNLFFSIISSLLLCIWSTILYGLITRKNWAIFWAIVFSLMFTIGFINLKYNSIFLYISAYHAIMLALSVSLLWTEIIAIKIKQYQTKNK